MRKLIFLALPLLLADCADLAANLQPPYVPVPIHIYDKDQYQADDTECKTAGINWKPHFSFSAIAVGAVSGATSDTSLIPFSPAVPVYGAAGGAVGAAAQGLDVMNGQHAAVYRNCLRDETRRDRSAIVADPRN